MKNYLPAPPAHGSIRAMKLTSHLGKLRVTAAILALTILCSPAFSADRQKPQGVVRALKVSETPQDIVDLGNTTIASTAKVPAAAGGDVFIHVRITLRVSRDVVGKINEGISSGRFQPPFETNKEFMDLIMGSRPGAFEVEFLGLNKESRFYYFFEQQLQKLKTHPSIPEGLRRRTNVLAQNAKKLIYQIIRPNDFEGARLVFEQGLQGGSIIFFGSTKRGNKEVGRVTFTAQEDPILEAMRRMLTEQKPGPRPPSVSEKGSLDEIIKSAQKKGILVSKP
ncbi:MAG: hypothetical protein NT105_21310 [Verrucomicrobia bacterium]|nr:hypothetical protein [Verrucomicrobiota bacterium]